MELILIGALSTVALAFVAYPLINPKKYVYYLNDLLGSREEKKLTYLESKKTLATDNLKDLEFEHEMRKLSDDDFGRLRDGLVSEAERIDKDIQKARIRRDIDEVIEREVRSRRKTR